MRGQQLGLFADPQAAVTLACAEPTYARVSLPLDASCPAQPRERGVDHLVEQVPNWSAWRGLPLRIRFATEHVEGVLPLCFPEHRRNTGLTPGVPLSSPTCEIVGAAGWVIRPADRGIVAHPQGTYYDAAQRRAVGPVVDTTIALYPVEETVPDQGASGPTDEAVRRLEGGDLTGALAALVGVRVAIEVYPRATVSRVRSRPFPLASVVADAEGVLLRGPGDVWLRSRGQLQRIRNHTDGGMLKYWLLDVWSDEGGYVGSIHLHFPEGRTASRYRATLRRRRTRTVP